MNLLRKLLLVTLKTQKNPTIKMYGHLSQIIGDPSPSARDTSLALFAPATNYQSIDVTLHDMELFNDRVKLNYTVYTKMYPFMDNRPWEVIQETRPLEIFLNEPIELHYVMRDQLFKLILTLKAK